jgi:hypothetical protein
VKVAHNPHLAPSDFHLFLHSKKHLAGQKFQEDQMMKNKVTMWLCAQGGTFLWYWNTKTSTHAKQMP